MRETRIFQAREVRAATEDDGIRVSGFAAVYDSWSGDLGGFKERIARGAFGPALEGSDVRFLLNHDGLPLARHRGRDTDTMVLEDRDEGLWFETVLDPSDPDVQRLTPKLQRGDLDQMSFAFSLPEDGSGEEWDYEQEQKGRSWEGRLRTITRFSELFDVSAVTYPAYVDTEVALRSLERLEGQAGPAVKSLAMRRRETELRLRTGLGLTRAIP